MLLKTLRPGGHAPRTTSARGGRRAPSRKPIPLQVEYLEHRIVPTDYRSITGLGNNVFRPAWGEAGVDLIRKSPVRYADGISAPSLPDNPGARALSNALNDQSNPPGR